MIPAKYLLIGAARWLELLRHSTPAQARQLLLANPEYSDLSMSNYQEAYEWLEGNDLLLNTQVATSPEIRVFEIAITDEFEPQANSDPEDLPSPGYLPETVLEASRCLGVPEIE